MIAEKKKNFIFDLYGTLLDIHTDETMPQLWQWLSRHYSSAGSGWGDAQIHRRYLDLVREKEEALAGVLQTEYPEIELRDVFRDLYREGLKNARCHQPGLTEISPDPEEFSAWIDATAAEFRQRSRLRFRLFTDTLPALRELHRRGKRVYLLSNAQACFTAGELEQLKLTPLLDGIYISSECQVKKPEKRFMQKLLEEEHLNPEDCVMIGNDYFSDIAAALQWKMDSIFLNTDGYPRREREQRLDKIRKKYQAPDYSPAVIASGKLMELF